MEIRQLYYQGLSISEISRRLNLDRKTVRKYAKSSEKPSYQKRLTKKTLLSDYKDYLIQRINQYNLTTLRLYKEIKEHGYQGSYSYLAKYVNNRTYEKLINIG